MCANWCGPKLRALWLCANSNSHLSATRRGGFCLAVMTQTTLTKPVEMKIAPRIGARLLLQRSCRRSGGFAQLIFHGMTALGLFARQRDRGANTLGDKFHQAFYNPLIGVNPGAG